MAVNLNEGQLAASLAVQRFVASDIISGVPDIKSNRYFAVEGAGGTGKTTSIFHALIPLIAAGHKVLLTAPTNKAVKVLRQSAKKWNLRIDACTMASALGVTMLPDEEKRYAAQVSPPKIPEYTIIVADEASMYSSRALDLLAKAVYRTKVKVIFLGDSFQLPPVKEERSEAFDIAPSLELTQNERFDGPVKQLTDKLRECIRKNVKPKTIEQAFGVGNQGNVEIKLGRNFVNEMLSQISEHTTPDDVRIIAWTNTQVDKYNQQIREKLFGRKPEPFYAGERIVTTEALHRHSDGEIMMNTDEECYIKNVQEGELVDPYHGEMRYRTINLIVEPLYAPGTDYCLTVIHPKDQGKLDDRLEWLASRAKKNKQLWSDYWAFRSMFHNIRHCWAITAHRAQGSTFKNVFVDVVNISRNKRLYEFLRLLYVAMSRPAGNLYLNRNKFVG